MEVWINNELEAKDVAACEELITRAFKIASQKEKLTDFWEVCVTFVDDPAIRLLNLEYRDLDAATDVLSFPQDDENFLSHEQIPKTLGDIIISLDSAKRQALDYGHSTKREVLYLAVHGFFHLLGYDHEDPEEQSIMREREEAVLAELNLARD